MGFHRENEKLAMLGDIIYKLNLSVHNNIPTGTFNSTKILQNNIKFWLLEWTDGVQFFVFFSLVFN